MEETLTHRSKCRTWKKGSCHPSTDWKWDILYYDEAEYGRRPDLRLIRRHILRPRGQSVRVGREALQRRGAQLRA